MRLFEQLEPRNMLATLIGTPGDDVFLAGPGWATLNDVEYIGDYDFVGNGGVDVAHLYDSPGDDVFTASPGVGSMGAVSVEGCRYVHGYSKAGGNDTARLIGSDGDDTFKSEVAVLYGKLYNDDFFLRAKFFETLEAEAGDGLDVASLYDSEEDDVVKMQPGDVTLFGTGYSQRVQSFRYVHAYAKAGGNDAAHLYGDNYSYDTEWCRAFGDDTVNRAKFFEEVMANRERVNAPVYTPVSGTTTTLTGIHDLRRSIELDDGDTLTGDALLQRGETVQKNLAQDAQEGVTRLFVPDTTGYTVGDELGLYAYNGTSPTWIIVSALGPDWIEAEDPITETYTVANLAAVVNYFPLIRAIGTGITIDGLIIDGNRDPALLQWQIVGGGLIHMEATDSTIDNVTVVNSPSAGIILKGGRDNLITDCTVTSNYGYGVVLDQEIDTAVRYTTASYNGGLGKGDGILVNGGAGHLIDHNTTWFNGRYGLHPAGDLTRGGIWWNNDASYNGSNGFHFCFNNFDILVTGNTFQYNGRSGVGGFGLGGLYADRFNIVTDNDIRFNDRWGVETNGGRDNTITFNDVRDNGLGGVLIVGDHYTEGNIE